MNKKHTRGPWIGKVDGVYPETDWSADHEHASTASWVAINAPNGSTVALATITGFDDDQLEANARLIAAAPDLLFCLQVICEHAGEDFERLDAMLHLSEAKKAIAMATGVEA